MPFPPPSGAEVGVGVNVLVGVGSAVCVAVGDGSGEGVKVVVTGGSSLGNSSASVGSDTVSGDVMLAEQEINPKLMTPKNATLHSLSLLNNLISCLLFIILGKRFFSGVLLSANAVRYLPG